ncbi:sigma-70 family RNA polymerase sigma factor [Verrucomicrobium sp. BvORR106]|uniref:RNA polymerase sigma factor n=1 Tax=Verrucomicrobium sp. BvORR106 TaxID=1403819 RepID=UPI00056DE900|nr:sigma-70 family RNA polymerase sigma factor [Verrucomicrobium sp. BvORR106]
MKDEELERLYDAHASGLFRYFAAIVKCEADARDLLQELFIKLAREKALLAESEKAWIYRMGHNLAVDWLRRRKTRADYELRSADEVGTMFSAAEDPDAKVLASQLEQALASLPEDQRTVTELKLWQGMTFEEIAETQRIPANTAASRYRYAVDKLRSLLRPLYQELKQET